MASESTRQSPSRALRARLAPLSLIVWIVIALGTPLTHLGLSVAQGHETARTMAPRVADALGDLVSASPRLWRYNEGKLARRIDELVLGDAVDFVRLIDADGHTFRWRRPGSDATPPSASAHDARDDAPRVAWARAELEGSGGRFVAVWIGVSTQPAVERSLWLVFACATFGLGLVSAIQYLAIAASVRAEVHIEDLIGSLERSQASLSEFNAELERRVDQRSAELVAALAEVEAQRARLNELSRRSTLLAEDERRALSRELHDSTGQSLTAIRIELERLVAQDLDPEARLAGARRTIELTDRTVDAMRRILARLVPAELELFGLAGALQQMAESAGERAGLEVHCSLEDGDDAADPALDVAVYRVAQEAVTNAIKHASATRVSLRSTRARGRIELCVEDDGCGFDPVGVREGGRGLSGMRERAELLAGGLTVDASPGRGTSIRLWLPRAPASDPESV